MLRSMTGFGAARNEQGERVYTVEARSVNHRFCEVRFHLPAGLGALAHALEPCVRERIARGRVDVAISIGFCAEATVVPHIDIPRARGYVAAYGVIAAALGYEGVPSLETIAAAPGVLHAPDATVEDGTLAEAVCGVLRSALDDLCEMREREGAALATEIAARLRSVLELAARIEVDVPRATEERRTRMAARITEIIAGADIDAGRLEQEVAILADRADVTEEITRLKSHAEQMERLLASSGAMGRKLDFLCQELGREANTIGAKCADARIAHTVVDLKAEIERMREQVQNVE